jgi:hypothetical protein
MDVNVRQVSLLRTTTPNKLGPLSIHRVGVKLITSSNQKTILVKSTIYSSSACTSPGKWAVMYYCAMGFNIVSTIFLLDFGTVLTVWSFMFYIVDLTRMVLFHDCLHFSNSISKLYIY